MMKLQSSLSSIIRHSFTCPDKACVRTLSLLKLFNVTTTWVRVCLCFWMGKALVILVAFLAESHSSSFSSSAVYSPSPPFPALAAAYVF